MRIVDMLDKHLVASAFLVARRLLAVVVLLLP